MPPTRMEYPSLKAVLQYLEANKRIDLVRRCPSLKTTDKTTPLTLRRLRLEGNHFIINTTFYYFGVIRQYPNDVVEVPEKIQKDNDDGGVEYDLDDSGLRDNSGDQVILLGDVKIQVAPGQETDNGGFREWLMRQSFYPEKPTPFKMYIKVTRGSVKDMKFHYEYLEYNKKLYEASKYLNDYFFGRRKHPIKVTNMQITVKGAVARLPEHVKFKVKNLYIGSNVDSVMNSTGHLLGNSPELVSIVGGSTEGLNYTHPVIKTAKNVVICADETVGDLGQIIRIVGNQRFVVRYSTMTPEEYIDVIDKMIEDKRPIGINFSFGVHDKDVIKNLYKTVKKRPGVAKTKEESRECSKIFPHVYNFPITDSSKLSIYCEDYKSSKEPFILWMRVEEDLKTEVVKVEKKKKFFGFF